MPEGSEGLTPADIHHLRAADGWKDLGLPAEAARELDQLSPGGAVHPVSLDVRSSLSGTLGDWSEAHRLASLNVHLHPGHEAAWISRAYAARRMPGGGLAHARDQLLPALDRFPENTLIPYNLACYACQLHDLDRAMAWFTVAEGRDAAFSDKPGKVRAMALKDDDLAQIHGWIRNGMKPR
jgi:hypothetical protein